MSASECGRALRCPSAYNNQSAVPSAFSSCLCAVDYVNLAEKSLSGHDWIEAWGACFEGHALRKANLANFG